MEKMKKKARRQSKLEMKFCGYDCEYAKAVKDRGACNTFNLIYCKKYQRQVNKGGLCLDNLK